MTPFAVGGAATATELSPFSIGLVAALFALSFFFSGTETAMFSLQKLDRLQLVGEGASGKRAVNLLERGRAPLLSTILMGNETVNVALAALTAGLITGLGYSSIWNLVLLTPALVLISEITPKVLAIRHPRRWAKWASAPLTALYWVLVVPRTAFTGIVGLLARAFGASTSLDRSGLEEQELMVIVDRGAAHGTVDPIERDIIEAVFDFDELTVERLMTPRPDMLNLSLKTTWEELLQACRNASFSRVPIYDDNVENIVGVLLVKDLLRHQRVPPSTTEQLRSLLLPPTFVPATKPADDMLREFLDLRLHMAFIVDEHGTLIGLITLDDLLDELLGDELENESQEQAEIVAVRPNVMHVRAAMDVEDFREETGIALPTGDWHTIGGFVFHELGRLPRQGDTVRWSKWSFIVASMDGRRIEDLEVMGDVPGPQTTAGK
jgi:CBS domain containing-hemolysin-like protein